MRRLRCWFRCILVQQRQNPQPNNQSEFLPSYVLEIAIANRGTARRRAQSRYQCSNYLCRAALPPSRDHLQNHFPNHLVRHCQPEGAELATQIGEAHAKQVIVVFLVQPRVYRFRFCHRVELPTLGPSNPDTTEPTFRPDTPKSADRRARGRRSLRIDALSELKRRGALSSAFDIEVNEERLESEGPISANGDFA
jgi:hypothetical protein